MRIAVWTPLPPEPSGIADYNATLLAAMARDPSVEMTAIVRDDVTATNAPARVSVCRVSDYHAEDYDLDLYHVGNNTLHRDIYQRALTHPGVVVLHDAVLQHLLLGMLDPDEYVEEFVYNYGQPSRDLGRQLWEQRSRSGADVGTALSAFFMSRISFATSTSCCSFAAPLRGIPSGS